MMRENDGLKRDCFNLSVQLKKTERDHATIIQRQNEIDGKANELAERYLKENVTWIGNKLNASNFSTCKQGLLKVIGSCRDIGFDVPEEMEKELIQNLQKGFEQAVRAQFAREEEARIKARAREDERLERERAKKIKDTEREKKAAEQNRQDAQRRTEDAQRSTEDARRRTEDAEKAVAVLRAAFEKALRATKDEHSAEVESYKRKLKEAEERRMEAVRKQREAEEKQKEAEERQKEAEEKQREAEENNQCAISQAQLTKAGHVYVLSNKGSFGDGVFKVGMTRREDREERVRELSGASVPFPFQVQMMIWCEDVPTLETTLHRELHKQRVNKTEAASRKEFFRVDLGRIREIVESETVKGFLESHGGKVLEIPPVPEEEQQYWQSEHMPDEVSEFTERTWESVIGDADASLADEE